MNKKERRLAIATALQSAAAAQDVTVVDDIKVSLRLLMPRATVGTWRAGCRDYKPACMQKQWRGDYVVPPVPKLVSSAFGS